MNSLEALQNAEPDNQGSNAFSSTSFIPEFIHRQSVKKPRSGPAVTLERKLKKLKYELFTTLSILGPVRMKPLQLRKQLCNYQYERIERKIESQSLQKFGRGEQQLFKQQQNLILILTSLMRQFKSSNQKYFYIISKKNSRVFYYHHQFQNGQYQDSRLIICNFIEKMGQDLAGLGNLMERVEEDGCEKMIVRGQGINIVWGWLVNKIIENQKHYRGFYIVANFPFPGSSETIPTQLFNGLQNKKQYSYLAKKDTNLLGEPIQQVYRLKIGGIWTLDNVRSMCAYLTDTFGEKGFDVQFQVDRVTQFIRDQQQEEDEDE